MITATFGMWLVSAALAGYFANRLSMQMRIIFAVAGLLALIPAGAFPGAIYTDAVGLVIGVPAMIFAYVNGRKTVQQAAT
ncbi:TRAP-type uncharacterized transport system%2C fused permease components [Mycobacterium tuberculosis]|nr:TRAP-type uncharacterized transport system%2C fused permease components [Mycobacterium tuberculosis]